MPAEECPFEAIAMDLVDKLSESEEFNEILVIMNRFTKVQPYIPAKTTWTAADIANVYVNEIWRLYGLLRHIASHYGTQFSFKFPKERNKKLGIILRLSTAHHPQSDRLSEEAVQTMKQYLRIYCHDRQSSWRAWLPLAEFAYHATNASTHKYSPCRSLQGFASRIIPVSYNFEF